MQRGIHKLNSGEKLVCKIALLIVVLGMVPVVHAGSESVNDAQALSYSLSYLQAKASDWGIQNANEEFRLRKVIRDELGQIHVRLDQVYHGVPVFGKQLVVHLNSDGTLRMVTGDYLPGIDISTQPKLNAQNAIEVALSKFAGEFSTEAELIVLPRGKEVLLTYRVVLNDDATPQRIVAFINAITGGLVHSYNDLHTLASSQVILAKPPEAEKITKVQEPIASPSTGIGHSLYSGTVSITTNNGLLLYSLLDSTRGNMITTDMMGRTMGIGIIFTDEDNHWGNGMNTDPDTAGVDAHFGAEMTWDYYLTEHDRNGIYDDERGTLSRVHYGSNYNNAFWSDLCRCMTYGDGDGIVFSPLVALDVVGHEMTHGVTSATAGLIYEDQSGGLNEAMSDIFGTAMEFYASVHGATKTPNYLIGEDIFTPATAGDALRYMDNPTQDGNSIDTFADYTNGMNVHYSSGIANNAFYLLSEGGTHRLGGTVTGIGRSNAENIFYRALVAYMIPGETFSQARADTIQAATDLFGPSSQEVTSVGEAWDAVGVV